MSYTSLHPQFVKYDTDGRGRDTYISYNNGGFWKNNIYSIHAKPSYDFFRHPKKISYYTDPPPFTYYSDGSGRDSYILKNNAGLKKNFVSLSQYHLKDFLRTPDSCIFNFKCNPLKEGIRCKTLYVSQKEFNKNNHIKSIEKGLKTRLYKNEKHKFIPPQINTEVNEIEPRKRCMMGQYARTHSNFYPRNFLTEQNRDDKQIFFREGKKKVKVSLYEL